MPCFHHLPQIEANIYDLLQSYAIERLSVVCLARNWRIEVEGWKKYLVAKKKHPRGMWMEKNVCLLQDELIDQYECCHAGHT